VGYKRKKGVINLDTDCTFQDGFEKLDREAQSCDIKRVEPNFCLLLKFITPISRATVANFNLFCERLESAIMVGTTGTHCAVLHRS